jgi:hypothetical protein
MRGPAPARKPPEAALAQRETRFATRSASQLFNPALSEEVETLAGEIAGPGANAETQELARQLAEAQIDLRGVRYARRQFLSDTLSKQYYDSYANMRMKNESPARFSAAQSAGHVNGSPGVCDLELDTARAG